MNKPCRYLIITSVVLLALISASLPQRANAQGAASFHAATPVAGGTIRIPLVGEPATLDPAQTSYTYEVGIGTQIFEGLTQLDQNNNVIPGIASSWSSPDSTVWTFTLRNDVYFHNGRQVKAADFLYSWNRAKTAGGPYASLFDNISTFTAPSDFTFIVTMTGPFVTFPIVATLPIFAVIPSEGASTIGTNPIGTGPFKFVSWTAGTKITLQKNASYYDTPAYLNGIEYKFYADADAAWAGFLASSLDLAPIPANLWNTLKTNPNVLTDNIMLTQSLGFDTAVFSDLRVRQAFQHAVNRTAIATSPYGSLQIATGVVSPGKSNYDNSDIVISYDPTAALNLLSQAGWTDTDGNGILDNGAGTNLSVIVQDSASTSAHAIALEVSNNLENIGGTGIGAAVTLTTDADAATIKRFGWISDYPAPDNDLLWYKTGGYYANRLHYGSATFDNYLNTALSTFDETARNAAFHSADAQLVSTDAVIFPLYYGKMTPMLKKANVQDFLLSARGYEAVLLKHTWLDNLTATTTTITSDAPEPSLVNQAVKIMVTVSGATTPTGIVNIIGANTNCVITLDVNGQGSCNVVFTSNGAKTIGAIYDGDSTHNSSVDVESHIVSQSVKFYSNGSYDGWILKSAENSTLGGTMNATAATLSLGDNAARKQYRSILSFNTASLPDKAVITKMTLKLKHNSVAPAGTNPINLLQGIFVDVKKGFFGTSSALQLTDFQAPANKTIGPATPALSSGWYTINAIGAKDAINLVTGNGGLTQFRLRFKLDDNNNTVANMLNFVSGNNATLTNRPTLIVEYYVP